MKKYTFTVTVTEVYSKDITVEAKNQTEARELVEQEIEACPIDTQSGALESSDTNIEIVK